MKKNLENLIGNYKDCYVGYSADKKVRINGSSGGIITSLLLFALQKKIINGAVVVRMNPHNPLKPEVFIARSGEEICSAQGSKYLPISLNEIVKVIEKGKG
ncbi:MAG TPA: coenzyme F420 hydrogenase/dehydrogenase beta subunit N-terminal domain-containing protein, partial [Candidatus Paceibacterota bacterium]|nr:coenzyme F420 hydrogenase/dehydrogenase beta subunit N-terminal domain-containing protein [Candidatus Paceibacterota bacterium]